VGYHTSVKQRGLNKIKEFEFKVQTIQPFMYKLICKYFIQASKLSSELLFRHCSCYNDTRGATVLYYSSEATAKEDKTNSKADETVVMRLAS
jgi:hypothetical protein